VSYFPVISLIGSFSMMMVTFLMVVTLKTLLFFLKNEYGSEVDIIVSWNCLIVYFYWIKIKWLFLIWTCPIYIIIRLSFFCSKKLYCEFITISNTIDLYFWNKNINMNTILIDPNVNNCDNCWLMVINSLKYKNIKSAISVMPMFYYVEYFEIIVEIKNNNHFKANTNRWELH
jgi:hypothetical protein